MKIGILGISAYSTSEWCRILQDLIRDRAEIYFPDDPAWDDIDWNSDDSCQQTVNEILDRQLQHISSCDHLIIYFNDTENAGLGARFELGRMFMTPGLNIHLLINKECKGRHYIRAHIRHAKANIIEHSTFDDTVNYIFS